MSENPTACHKSTEKGRIFPFSDEAAEMEAISGFTLELSSRLSPVRDQVVDPRNTLKFRHGRSWSGPPVENADREGEFTQHSHEVLTKYDQVIAGDLGLVERTISEIADGMSRSFKESVFLKMHEVTEKTGNIVRGGIDKKFPDVLVEMYQKIKLYVGRDGRISLPSIFASLSQQEKFESELAEMDTDQRERLDAIIDERAREALAEERLRRARFEYDSDE